MSGLCPHEFESRRRRLFYIMVLWPSGLRRSTQVRVYICRRGFESHRNHAFGGISSIGRVPRLQRGGTGIETRILQSFGTQGPQWRNWIAHQTSNLGVVGSNPTWGVLFCRADWDRAPSGNGRSGAYPRRARLWRNGSALDSRPKGWGFESL